MQRLLLGAALLAAVWYGISQFGTRFPSAGSGGFGAGGSVGFSDIMGGPATSVGAAAVAAAN